MIGRCPHCGISLKEPPFNKRETNEVMIVMAYRRIIDNNQEPKNITEIGYCEVCRATPEDKEEQTNLTESKHKVQ